MHELVADRVNEIVDLCRRLEVRRLDLFGSALGDAFDVASSDVDILVEFATGQGIDHFGTYFALKEGLEAVLGRPVDLVSGSSIRNPFFRQQVMDTRETLYAA
ncbi:nucleotidyltransferase family protein [Umezawaea endophytica]|uniref:Nucleotidyltransferase domain-containing protein n=1 Tax=Umezawaea endophytica TaxID=1654476 RepID=A0A9X2VWB1_9PSEU|nr:nucleotidyltransferase domain-containing protein [Umezawaea endophytica]MCS7483859.1 nucleotidyltransferase domain-containing protein [Umezawaea endophytica]